MKHVSIILPQSDLVLSSVVGPFKLFNQVNRFLEQQGAEAYYQVSLVAVSPLQESISLYEDSFQITPHQSIQDDFSTDLIIIPSFSNKPQDVIAQNSDLSTWLLEQHQQNGAEIASLCMGAFCLADTGLLDGKIASTHWLGAEGFRAMYPNVKLKMERIITDESGIYTSGGAYSFLNLILHLIEKFNGRELAIWISKVYEIDISRINQKSFVIFSSQKDHEDQAIVQAQEFIESNYHDKLSVEEISSNFALSRRNFIRRFKNATQNTPIEYIQRVRVEAAKKLLEQNASVSEVLSQVGYIDDKAFRQVFKRFSGLSPAAYKSKYAQVPSNISI